MMENKLEYKGYYTIISYSAADKVLHGKLEGINDLVNFESETAAEIEKEFHDAVDDYLDFCKDIGKEPDKTYKGSFNIRIDPRLHRLLAAEATKEGVSLNQVVESAIKEHLYYKKALDFSVWTNYRVKLIEKINELASSTNNWSEKSCNIAATYSWSPAVMADATKGV